jgi:hypothetical protein
LGAVAAPVLLLLAACGESGASAARQVCGTEVSVSRDGAVVEVDGPTGTWGLTWYPAGAGDLTSITGALPLRTTETVDGLARVTTPDRGCTAVVGATPPAVRVLGDSLSFQVARDGLAPWQGTAGAAFITYNDDPAVAAIDEVRGAVADDPDVLVLQYGANDALWSARDPEARRPVVARAIEAALEEASSVPCVWIVTPSAGDTDVLDGGLAFQAEAEAIAGLIRDLAPAGAVADWTALSAPHHLPDGDPDDWFPDGDEIHPNDAGQAALVALVDEAIARC